MGRSQNEFHRIIWVTLTCAKGPVTVLSPGSGLHLGRVLDHGCSPPVGLPDSGVTSAPPASTAIFLRLKSGGVAHLLKSCQQLPIAAPFPGARKPNIPILQSSGGGASLGDKGHCGSGPAWSRGLRPNVCVLQMRKLRASESRCLARSYLVTNARTGCGLPASRPVSHQLSPDV